MKKVIRIGSRESRLAVTQTELIKGQIEAHFPAGCGGARPLRDFQNAYRREGRDDGKLGSVTYSTVAETK